MKEATYADTLNDPDALECLSSFSPFANMLSIEGNGEPDRAGTVSKSLGSVLCMWNGCVPEE